MSGEAGGRMTLGRWGLWTAGLGLAAFAIWFLAGRISLSVLGRDEDWVPGPFAGLADLVYASGWLIALFVFLVAQVPAVLWRRRGGSPPGTLGVAVAMPLAVFGVGLIPKGHPEDQLIPFIAIAIGLLATLAAAVICVLVRPVEEPD